jgi:hypothetical protein
MNWKRAVKSQERYFRIDRQQIGLFRFILEAYDGIASLTTVDPDMGRVLLRVPPGREKEVDLLLAELADEIYLEPEDATNP